MPQAGPESEMALYRVSQSDKFLEMSEELRQGGTADPRVSWITDVFVGV